MLESGSRGGRSPTQFGNLKLEDVPQHVLATILNPEQAQQKAPQQQRQQRNRNRATSIRIGDKLHTRGEKLPYAQPLQAKDQTVVGQGVSSEPQSKTEGCRHPSNGKQHSESRHEGSSKKAGSQMASMPAETLDSLQSTGSIPKPVMVPTKGSLGADNDMQIVNDGGYAAACRNLASKDGKGGLSQHDSRINKNFSAIKEVQGEGLGIQSPRAHGERSIDLEGSKPSSTITTSGDPVVAMPYYSQSCQTPPATSITEVAANTQPSRSDVASAKPMVVVAIPSTSGSHVSKKQTWVNVAAKKPIHVRYTTQAAGTLVTQDRRTHASPSSQLQGTPSPSSRVNASLPRTIAPSSNLQTGMSDKLSGSRKSKSFAGATRSDGKHELKGSVVKGLPEQSILRQADNPYPGGGMDPHMIGQISHHQSSSESNLKFHPHHMESATQRDDNAAMSSIAQGLGRSFNSSSQFSQKQQQLLCQHKKDTIHESGVGTRKSIGRQVQDVDSGNHCVKTEGSPTMESQSYRRATIRRSSSKTESEPAQSAQDSVGAAVPPNTADRFFPDSGTNVVPAHPSTSCGEDHASIFVKPVKSEKIVNLVDFLCSTEPMQPCRFWEQGITNLGNTCFLGSAIQMLLGSGHFCAMLVRLGVLVEYFSPVRLPTLFALGELANKLAKRPDVHGKYSTTPQGPQGRAGRSSQAIVPTMLSPILESFHKRFSSHVGGPEEHDAQEFLLFLLDKIESELSIIKAHVRGQVEEETQPESDSEEWMIAGKKNKGTYRRTTGSKSSNILISLFCGTIESHVCVKDQSVKNKTPSVTTHRFTALDLDIGNDKVHTIDDALKLYTDKDIISGYRVEGCIRPVTAEKANLLGNMPPVLLVSLKRYKFTERGMEKIQKRISFQTTLQIPSKLMVAREHAAQYELVATCSHHGLGHGGDHYTSNVKQPGGSWVHFDDSMHCNIREKDVISDTPYLMLYMKVNPRPM